MLAAVCNAEASRARPSPRGSRGVATFAGRLTETCLVTDSQVVSLFRSSRLYGNLQSDYNDCFGGTKYSRGVNYTLFRNAKLVAMIGAGGWGAAGCNDLSTKPSAEPAMSSVSEALTSPLPWTGTGCPASSPHTATSHGERASRYWCGNANRIDGIGYPVLYDENGQRNSVALDPGYVPPFGFPTPWPTVCQNNRDAWGPTPVTDALMPTPGVGARSLRSRRAAAGFARP
jgi:hypothetical protein